MHLIIEELRNKLADLQAKCIVMTERDKQLEQMVSRCIRIMAEAMAWHEHHEGSISDAPWYCSIEEFRRDLMQNQEKVVGVALDARMIDLGAWNAPTPVEDL